MQLIDEIPVFGELQKEERVTANGETIVLPNALDQIKTVERSGAIGVALMADHHVGYSMPIGGVAAYYEQISPSGVGYDIACGNAAVQTNLKLEDIQNHIQEIGREIANTISFGVGRKNKETVSSAVFCHNAWNMDAVAPLKDLAQSQLGTVGAGNHYIDILVDTDGFLWIANHFGSRGLGHKIATHFIKTAGGKDDMFVEPVVLDVASQLGQEYLAAMDLAGQYAYAGRDWVIGRVVDILGKGVRVLDYVHNHHNYAWHEDYGGGQVWVVRKGATPLHPGQRAFIGGSMGDISVVVHGANLLGDMHPEQYASFCSAPHGAGRVMSRTKAAGKKKFVHGKLIRTSKGVISREAMNNALQTQKVALFGGDVDEAPQVYKDLITVLEAHKHSVNIEHVLRPVIVVMAPPECEDPYKD